MGIHDNARIEKKDKQRAKKQLPLPWESKGTEQEPVSWTAVDPHLIAYVVGATCSASASVQFTISRDQGSLGFRVYDDALETKTAWYRPGEGLEDVLYAVGDYYRVQAGEEIVRW